MVSLLILIFINFCLLTNYRPNQLIINEILLSNLSTSITVSIASLGLICLLFINLEITNLYILIPLSILLVFFLLIKKNYLKFCIEFFTKIYLELKSYIFSREKKNTIIIFLFLTIILTSIGPINHPDTSRYYVGYINQFFLQNKFIVDGGLHQPLLGLSDFINLSFFQERSVWLIRSIQTLPLILILIFQSKVRTSKLITIVFLTLPVCLQFFTIGKTIFLGDACLSINYLAWIKLKDQKSFFNTIISAIIIITFKISSLIIIFPIILHLFSESNEFLEFIKLKFFLTRNKIYILNIFIALISIITIALYKYNLTENFIYPLFNNYIVPNNNQMVEFWNFLRSYKREFLFSFKLIFPFKINEIGMVLGPATGLILISLIIKKLKSRERLIVDEKTIGIFQLLLLLLFGQGRSDYYISPLILIFTGSKFNSLEFITNDSKAINIIYKSITKFLILFQLLIFISLSSFSIYQSILTSLDYRRGMTNFAHSYNISEIIESNADYPAYTDTIKVNLLYSKKEYIHEDKFSKCINNEKDNIKNIETIYSSCYESLGARSLITNRIDIENSKLFDCKRFESFFAARNIFNKRKVEFMICKLNKSK